MSNGQKFLSSSQPIHPHLFRHQMLTYLTAKGLTDAQIQLISGHESKKSLKIYPHLSLESTEKTYQDAVQTGRTLMQNAVHAKLDWWAYVQRYFHAIP